MLRFIVPLVLVLGALVPSTYAQQKTIAQTAIDAGNFNTLVAAAKAADLVETLNGHTQLTVFAPTDEAFAKIDPATIQTLLKPENKGQLASILTYHVVAGRVNAKDAYELRAAPTVNGQRVALDFMGDRLKVGEANIVVTDIQCSNGVIHVIDTVLLPSSENIPSTAKAAGSFNTLLAAVGAAGLGDVLSGPGPFTVFAPTDDAFAALPEGTVESLLLPENKQKLIDILKYHVVSGRVYDTDAVKAATAPTLLGRSLDINLSADGIAIGNAKVVAKNIETTNGVIHVIDSVLIPSAMSRDAAMRVLENAVSEGAPIYNSGHHGQCCDIYSNAMNEVLSAGIENADHKVMTMIENTLSNASHMHSDAERAWELRRGIDSLYSRLGHMKSMSPKLQTRR